MKYSKYYLIFAFIFLFKLMNSQASFSITPSLCIGDVASVQAQSGTITASNYSWSVFPIGPVISFASSQSTNILFNAFGTYTVSLLINGVSSYTQSVYVMQPPSLSISTTNYSLCTGFTSTLTVTGASTYTWTGTNIISPLVQQTLNVSPGTYSVVGTAPSGCMNSQTITIGLQPPLSLTLTQSSPTACIASNIPKYSTLVKLVAQGAFTYVWSPYDPMCMTYSIGPTMDTRLDVSACYTVIGSSYNCSATAVICVSVIPQFTVQLSSTATQSVCVGEPVTISISSVSSLATGPASAFSYTWWALPVPGPGQILSPYSSSTTVLPPVTTNYTLEMLDAAGCIAAPKTIGVYVDHCTGITENHLLQGLSIFPNPARGQIFIHSKDVLDEVEIKIMNNIGELIIRESTSLSQNSSKQIDLKNFQPGLYYVTIITGRKSVLVSKFVLF